MSEQTNVDWFNVDVISQTSYWSKKLTEQCQTGQVRSWSNSSPVRHRTGKIIKDVAGKGEAPNVRAAGELAGLLLGPLVPLGRRLDPSLLLPQSHRL